jgi:type 1 fimbria pilin
MRMRKTSFIVFSFLFSLNLMSSAMADSLAGWGRVNMQGAIIDTACAIAVESREQTIDMETIPLAEIIRNGKGRSKNFTIELVNCMTKRLGKEDWKQFQVTFDGDAEGDSFGVHGDASGISLQIIDRQGNVAIPGQALPALDIETGTMQLNYTIQLVANKNALKSGAYHSTIRFKLDYY